MESGCKICGGSHITGACTEKVVAPASESAPKYIVGAKKRKDGTLDTSKALTWDGNNSDGRNKKKRRILSDVERKRFASVLKSADFRGKNRELKFKAKELGVSPEALLNEMREFVKTRVDSPEKVHHYHRTSIENLGRIIAARAMLSRSEIKKRDPKANLPAWSASDDVMMTRDVFDKDGKLISPGLTPHGVGASGAGVVLVMGPKITALDNYDATMDYPTVSNMPLEGNCTTILVNDDGVKLAVESMLAAGKINDIKVVKQDEWEKKHYK